LVVPTASHPRPKTASFSIAPERAISTSETPGLRSGLKAAGFRGDVASIIWTFTANPAIDQAVKFNARLAGERLARTIEAYQDQFPERPVNVAGLSAGTGVAVFACEDLKPGYKVDNVVLLAGSISHNYNVGPALRNIRGKIYNFYSSQDLVLSGPMKLFGTIDGKLGTDGVGLVGLSPPSGRDRVVNIRWRPEFRRYGYYGGHTDITSAGFVKNYLAQYLTERVGAADTPRTAVATRETSDSRSVLLAGD
jgi:pimeloyl-ACP methyl ester carboxylesterase